MISYAQNAEDVVLARLFGRAGKGRYVDVGAADPVEASVTKHFYDLGWRGINIEPLPGAAARLRAARPDDVTLAVALGAHPGQVKLHVVGQETGWSTLDDELAGGHPDVREIDVEMMTLRQVLDEHPGPVDFLKIDVEGWEAEVIAGADWARHRPRVVVVEATLPGTAVPAHEQWEPTLVAAGYRCALFDGLNRFYAEATDDEALRMLAAPASVLDEFEPYRQRLERDERVALAGYVRRLEAAVAEARAARAKDAEYLSKLEDTIERARRGAVESEKYVIGLERRIDELEAELRRAREA